MPGLAESWITTCCSRACVIYETLRGKEEVYVLQISSVLGRLPVKQAGDMFHTNFAPGCTRLHFGTHCFDHDLARKDSAS